jgi:hypothetical protein
MRRALVAAAVLVAAFSAGLSVAASAAGERLPEPPCGSAAWPAPAALGAPPAVAVVARGERALRWRPPACAGWEGDGFRMVVALAGRITVPGGADAVLARFGAVSRLPEQRVRGDERLVTAAHALDAPKGPSRGDFAPAELRTAPRFFSEAGTFASSAVTHRLQVREASADRIVIAIENVDAMRKLMFDLFDPGELQSLFVLERDREGGSGGDVWTYYHLMRTREGASALTEGHDASYANRALALFRLYAGAAETPVTWWR